MAQFIRRKHRSSPFLPSITLKSRMAQVFDFYVSWQLVGAAMHAAPWTTKKLHIAVDDFITSVCRELTELVASNNGFIRKTNPLLSWLSPIRHSPHRGISNGLKLAEAGASSVCMESDLEFGMEPSQRSLPMETAAALCEKEPKKD